MGDKPAGCALIDVEIFISHAQHIGGGDLLESFIQRHVKRPVSRRDKFINFSSDRERAISLISRIGERLGDCRLDFRGSHPVLFKFFDFIDGNLFNLLMARARSEGDESKMQRGLAQREGSRENAGGEILVRELAVESAGFAVTQNRPQDGKGRKIRVRGRRRFVRDGNDA